MSRIDTSVLSENDPQLAEALSKATTSAEIRAALQEQMERQGAKPTRDPNFLDTSEMRLHESLLPKFKQVEIIDGKPYEFEAPSQAELTHKIVEAYRELASATDGVPDASRDARGRFAAQPVPENPVEKAELELAFKRGDISVSDYLLRSGALDSYAKEKWGLDVDAISSRHQMQAAQDATDQFLQNHPEWPGGSSNLKIMGDVIKQNFETLKLDQNDLTADVLEKVYQHCVANNLLVENEEVRAEYEKRIRDARTPEELRAAAAASQGRSGSSLWG